MKFLALDVGDKTIGVAVTDALLLTAQGVMTIDRVGARKDADRVIQLIRTYDCSRVVVGLPMNLNGTNSIQTDKVEEFKILLENKMRSTGLSQVEVVFQDERFTTVIAENVLIQGDVSRKKRKEVIDKQAAVVILQSYMDRYRNDERRKQEQAQREQEQKEQEDQNETEE